MTCTEPVNEKFTGCECKTAEQRIDSGDIRCGYDQCPEDCEVCKVCLLYVVDDCFKGERPNITPGFITSISPTPAPSLPPPPLTLPPSSPPTMVEEVFDLAKCDTYTDVW